MKKQHVNTFYKGMRQDVSKSMAEPGTYYNAKNIRIVAQSTSSESGAAVTIGGTEIAINIQHEVYSTQYGYNTVTGNQVPVKVLEGTRPCQFVGQVVLRDTLILFCIVTEGDLKTEKEQEDKIYSNKTYAIYKVDLSSKDSDTSLYNYELVYESPELNFNVDYPISAVARYESELIQRVYWTDNLNPIRVLNIAENNSFLDITQLELSTEIDFVHPEISRINEGGGNLVTGVYHYGYRLRTENSKTRVSSYVGPLNIVLGNTDTYWLYDEDPENTTQYDGTEPGIATTKSVTINFTDVDLDYKYLDLIAVYKGNEEGVSIVTIADTALVTPGVITTIHANNDGAPLLIEEATEITSDFNKAKTLEVKDNRLFIANVESSNPELEFNSRAYRYKRTDQTDIDGCYRPIAPRLINGEMQYFIETYIDDEEDLSNDAVNPYNNFTGPDDEGYRVGTYKYKKDGATIGGEGPNISYKFIKKELSGDSMADQHRDSAPFINGNFETDYKNPIIAESFVGYQRDETYRFGIVLFDKKGNPGFVNWIGDIRFPRYDDIDYAGDDNWNKTKNFTLSQTEESKSGYNYSLNYDDRPTGVNTGDLYNNAYYDSKDVESPLGDTKNILNSGEKGGKHSLYALGIQFTVDIPETDIHGNSLRDKISGYQIVRVKRTDADKSILSTGVITPMNFMKGYFNDGENKDSVILATNMNASYSSDLEGQGNIRDKVGKNTFTTYTFDSPEVHFLKLKQLPENSELHLTGFLSHGKSDYATYDATDYHYTKLTSHTPIWPNIWGTENEDTRLSNSVISTNSIFERGDILNLNLNFNKYSIDGDEFIGVFNSSMFVQQTGAQYELISPAGACEKSLFIETDYAINPFELGNSYMKSELQSGSLKFRNDRDKYLATIKKINPNRYNGSSAIDRSTNTYIACGNFVPLSEETKPVDVWGGDTYVTFYDIKKTISHVKNGSTFPMSAYNKTLDTDSALENFKPQWYAFPVESTINTTLRRGFHFANDGSAENILNEFIYEDVYSAKKDLYTFIPKPLSNLPSNRIDTRVLYSGAKINGESVDSWRSFKLEDYTDLDGNRGEVNKLVTFKDNLYFLQSNGFGALAISPTSTVLDESGTSIVLGTGSVIQDFQYLSNTVGTVDSKSVISTEKGIYWVDRVAKKIYAFRANGLECITDIHGMKSWASREITKDTQLNTGYDTVNSEVLFSHGDYNSLVFNETINAFTSFYNTAPTTFIEAKDKLLGIRDRPHLHGRVYEHNTNGKYNYGSTLGAEIQFIVNPDPLYTKTFDTIVWSVKNTKGLFLDESNDFNNITFQVDSPTTVISELLYSIDPNTDKIIIKSEEYSQRENQSVLNIPRNSNEERIRGTYMLVTFKQGYVNKTVLNYVKTLFRISKR
jgi:hypothetical protein